MRLLIAWPTLDGAKPIEALSVHLFSFSYDHAALGTKGAAALSKAITPEEDFAVQAALEMRSVQPSGNSEHKPFYYFLLDTPSRKQGGLPLRGGTSVDAPPSFSLKK